MPLSKALEDPFAVLKPMNGVHHKFRSLFVRLGLGAGLADRRPC
jgi:hypothetical protein